MDKAKVMELANKILNANKKDASFLILLMTSR